MDTISQLPTILQNFYRAFWIPTSIYQGTDCLVSYVPIAFPFDDVYQHLIGQSIVRREDPSYSVHAGILTGLIRIAQSDLRVLVGPVSSVPCNSRLLDSLLSSYALPLSSKASLQHWLTHTPTIGEARFLAMLRFLNNILNSANKTPMDADAVPTSETAPPSFSTDQEPEIQHGSQQLEGQILSAIEAGNPTRLLQVLLQIPSMDVAFGYIGDTSVQNLQNIAITTAVLSSRAAVRAGMDYEYALSLSDHYIHSLRLMENETDYPPLIGSIMMDFCERVREIHQPGQVTMLTKSVISYVMANLYHRLTVAGIADHLGYNASYISHVFRQDMGVPLKTWMQEQKIREADRLMRIEGRSISETAAALGYSSVPHFQTAYKQVTGHTPGRQEIASVRIRDAIMNP